MEPILREGFKYNPDHSHCWECLCAVCIYFYKNSGGGDCDDACKECDGVSHVVNCYSFDDMD
jgi:hypothetical protein